MKDFFVVEHSPITGETQGLVGSAEAFTNQFGYLPEECVEVAFNPRFFGYEQPPAHLLLVIPPKRLADILRRYRFATLERDAGGPISEGDIQIAHLENDALDGDPEAFAELRALADEGDIEAEIMAELVPDFIDFDEPSDQDGEDMFA